MVDATGALVLGDAGASRAGWWDEYGELLETTTKEWLERMKSACTARAYGRDLGYRVPVTFPGRGRPRSPLLGGLTWWAWLSARGLDPFTVPEIEVIRWLRALDDAGYSASTRARALAAMRAWYRYLLRTKLFADVLTVSPAASVSAAAQGIYLPEQSNTIALTPVQAAGMIEAADVLPGPMRLRNSATVALMLTTAVRVGECCALAVQDQTYDQGRRKLRVLGKGGRYRSVGVPDLAEERLVAYLDSRPDLKVVARRGHAGVRARVPLLMTRTGRPITRTEVWRVLRRAAELAELPRELVEMMTPHATRHTAAKIAQMSGADLEQIRLLLGHVSARTTQRYVHASGEEVPFGVGTLLEAAMTDRAVAGAA
ncbi:MULTISPECIES: tyrosine-type recombinase/integrase [unclassified Amycolatopsis]|uniref:tyrosine-type recombinase/integrase n=1 Tax=unclassified Amycolatopsis TaxID=2618356 RepID=UPI0028769217|nr:MULTISPECIES: tyrosine-type recombinase/integrase [unclassified Amycolatopsis]MDS0140601.1 tyrosine-type recombinase/integrase [Amycolatopsis sp. 505]MDS0149251.1 tyrosine-type recombinase/integrase [Amycolatopsis sp. CM201R]